MDNIDNLQTVKELVNKNFYLLNALKGYFLYDLGITEDTTDVIAGIEYSLKNQEQIIKLLKTI